MVRLKDHRNVMKNFTSTYFNSTMVRLKVDGGQIILLALINFNSTMVRLKVESSSANKVATRIFQFHYGSVKRGMGRTF